MIKLQSIKLPWVKKDAPPVAGSVAGGAAGGIIGTQVGKKMLKPKDLVAATDIWRKTKDSIPMTKLYGKRVLPVALVLAAIGAIGGGMAQQANRK